MVTEKSSNKRKDKRLEAKSGIAVTPNAVCQVVNLSKDGISFKCTKEHYFPFEWTMNIYDIAGQSLEQLHVKKVWESWLNIQDDQSPFTMEVGGRFQNLSSSQKDQLNTYLQQLLAMEE